MCAPGVRMCAPPRRARRAAHPDRVRRQAVDKKRHSFYQKDARAAATVGSMKLKVNVCACAGAGASAAEAGACAMCVSLWPQFVQCLCLSVFVCISVGIAEALGFARCLGQLGNDPDAAPVFHSKVRVRACMCVCVCVCVCVSAHVLLTCVLGGHRASFRNPFVCGGGGRRRRRRRMRRRGSFGAEQPC